MAGADGDDSLYPIAVLIDELRNEDVQVCDDTRVYYKRTRLYFKLQELRALFCDRYHPRLTG